MGKIARISLTLPEDLLKQLDRFLSSRKYPSRSEAVRDAVTSFLAEQESLEQIGERVVGVLLLLYDHEIPGLPEKIIELQHESGEVVAAAQHIHIDERNCLEIIPLRGEGERIRKLVERLGALRGVKFSRFVRVPA
jgi:CopG family nickel-responsive transcriptional regulator